MNAKINNPNNPIYRLGMKVLSGDLSLEQALAQVATKNFSRQVADDTIDEFDDYIYGFGRQNAQQATLLGRLNHRVAQIRGSAWVKGNCNSTLGWLYLKQNMLQQSSQHYREALRFLDPKGGAAIRVRLELGEIQIREGNLSSAKAQHQRALKLARKAKNPRLECDAQNYLGTIYLAWDQVENAQAAFQEALEISQKTQDRYGEATALGNLGRVDHYLGRLDRAVELHQEALTISQGNNHQAGVGRHLGHLGSTYFEMGQLEEAERYFQEALQIAHKIPDRLSEQQRLGNLGSLYQTMAERTPDINEKRQRLTQAEQYHTEALTIARHRNDIRGQARHLNGLGRVQSSLNNFGKAKELYTEALSRAQQSKAVDGLWRIHFAWGDLYASQEQNQSAFDHYSKAIEIVEKQRNGLADIESRMQFWQERAILYKHMALSCFHLGKLWSGLEYTEKAKTRYLTDLLAEQGYTSDNTSSIIPKTLQALKAKTSYLTDLLAKRGDISDTTASIIPKTLQALSSHTAIVIFNVTEAGTVVSIVAKQFTFATKDVERLGDGWQVSSDGRIWAKLIAKFNYHDLQQMLVQLNNERKIIGGYLGDYYHNPGRWHNSTLEKVCRELYEKLLAPVDRLLTFLGFQQIIIMPNLGLSALPLHACYNEKNNITRDYFLDHYQAISYAPNFYMLYHSQQQGDRKPVANLGLLAIANPDPKDPLLWAEVEVDNISRFFSPEQVKILDDGLIRSSTSDNGSTQPATVETVKKNSPHYSLVHFACHGEFNLVEPLQSKLYLAPPNELTLDIILEDMKGKLPDTYLVVMSACETGMIDPTDLADEYISLPAGFLLAGAPGVISTLWAVDDLSTALLMERFYHNHLKEKMPLAVALRRAQLWLRDELTLAELKEQNARVLSHDPFVFKKLKQEHRRLLAEFNRDESARPFAHPYYWASFTFAGA